MAVVVAVVNWWYRLTVTGSGIVPIPGTSIARLQHYMDRYTRFQGHPENVLLHMKVNCRTRLNN